MKRAKLETFASPSRLRLLQLLTGVAFLCLLFISFEIPLVSQSGSQSDSIDDAFESLGDALPRVVPLGTGDELAHKDNRRQRTSKPRMREFNKVSGLVFNESLFNSKAGKDKFLELHKEAKQACVVGKKLWDELQSGKIEFDPETRPENLSKSCPHSISLSGNEFRDRNRVVVIPCGLTLGSHITVVGTPRWAHAEYNPKISMLKEGDDSVMVSQFMIELQGLKTVDGEEPPRILHFNPRLKGDWSGKPVIEQNTCYRMQWGSALRCEGWKSRADEETVDGQVKCEKWIRDDDNHTEESKAVWWLNRLIGMAKKVSIDWPYPFAEGKLFVLTLSAGFDGYRFNVDGRHVTSFPYRTGFILEEATGLFVNGDIDVHSIFAASLPTSHPSFRSQMHLEIFTKWKAPAIPDGPVELFIGILSAGSHFAERMAVRKSWMQHKLIRSSHVVARFFVALHGRKEVNLELMKEAEYFGDIVIVPYMDNYDLLVLKTIAICDYGVHTVAAKYIMKCDDDTFVRVDIMIKEVRKVDEYKSIYIGNINFHYKVLRHGKWAVTDQEWPEDYYPPYANGPAYILSSDIAQFIISEFEKNKLELFKMEDVSMARWVGEFNSSSPVQYVHSFKFCQGGCIEDYYTAHYQSPRQMICLWEKLQSEGKPQCCNSR